MVKRSIENVMIYNLPHDGKREKAVVQQRCFHTPIYIRRLLRDQSRRFFFIFSRNAEWRQLNRFCKLVLRHEAIDYLREQKCRRDHETAFSALPKAELDKLCTVGSYPSDCYVFSAHGYDLPISNELVAEAFASLSTQAQTILILRSVLDMTDKEIGEVIGLSRSTVQEHRTKNLYS